MSLVRTLLDAMHKLRDAEAPNGKPPRTPTSPKQKPGNPGQPKGQS